jgi:hypothetical protein
MQPRTIANECDNNKPVRRQPVDAMEPAVRGADAKPLDWLTFSEHAIEL